MAVVVWSEREGAYGWKDCMYASYLTALVWAGFLRFPSGIYSNTEREAFEGSDNRTDETGAGVTDCDLAATRRYGVKLANPGWTISQIVVDTGAAWVISGNPANLPYGSSWRRWQPSGNYKHAVCIRPLGNGKVWLGDPLAPMGFGGDIETTAHAITFTRGFDQRYLSRRAVIGSLEQSPMLTPNVDPATHRPLQGVKVKSGTRAYRSNTTYADSVVLNTTEVYPLLGNVNGSTSWRGILVSTGHFYTDGKVRETVAYIAGGAIASTVAIAAPKPDCGADVAEAVKPLNEQIGALEAQNADLTEQVAQVPDLIRDGIAATVDTAVADAVAPYIAQIRGALEALA